MAITKINTPELLDINTTGAKQLPSGTTAQRPTTGLTAGDFRYNTDDNYVEYYDGAAWFQIDYEAVAPTCTTDTINYPVAITAYYKMSDATDQTGNYNGTATSVDFNVAGKFGNAGEFNGSSSGITSSSLGTALNVSSLSFSLWFKTNLNDSTDRILISSYDGSGNARFYASLLNSGLSVVIYGSSSTYIQNFINTVTTGTWYHLSVTHTGTTTTVYLNGTAITPSSTTGSPVAIKIAGSPQPLTMGQLQGSVGTYDFNGSIDQVRIFSTALTAANVTSLYNELQCAPTIVPTNNFNVNTYVGNGSTQTIDAKFNEAANFNGSSSYIYNNVLDTSTTKAVSIWVKANDFNERWAFQQGDGQSLEIFIRFYNIDDIQVRIGGVTQTFSGYSTNTWYHIVAQTNTSGNANVWINGVEVGTSTATQPLTVNKTNIGVRYNTGIGYQYYFNGSIDQVRIFDTALTGTQVTDLYTNETDATAQLLNFPVGAGCIAAYKLDGNADDISGLYSGTPTDIGYTGMQFAPDFVWLKDRDVNYSHQLYDTVRGATEKLHSNTTAQEVTDATGLTAFNTNGFTISTNVGVNTNNNDYVAWNWKAAGFANAFNVLENGTVTTSSSNTTAGITAGSITTGWNVSANRDAGFSVVSYTGNGVNGDTVGHGLSAVPNVVIWKNRSDTRNWVVWHSGLTSIDYSLILNSTSAEVLDSRTNRPFGQPTDSVLVLGEDNETNFSSNNFIAYCFHSVDGMSDMGSYVGTGATGNGIVTGFRPAFLLVKRTSSASDWYLIDNKRNSSNPRNSWLNANTSTAEYTPSHGVDFLSNGFSFISTDLNGTGQSWIFMAFAAEPTPEPVLANSFKTVIYTGGGASAKSITSLNFQPDFVWIKSRTSAASNVLHDTLTQPGLLISNGTNALINNGSNTVTFTSNGFNLQGGASHTSVNGSNDFVAWCWKAGGLPAINNEGSIESIVSANPAAGFSVVKYTGNSTTGATVGHGLNEVPEMIFVKRLQAPVDNWAVYNVTIGNSYRLALDDPAAKSGPNRLEWNNTTPTSTVFTLGNHSAVNQSSSYIAYCFTSIAGYQKIGTYPGTGVNGNAITGVGFQPTWLLVKRTDVADNWVIVDSARGASLSLFPDDVSQELNNSGAVSFELDGFTVNGASGGWNNGSGTYIYLAIK